MKLNLQNQYFVQHKLPNPYILALINLNEKIYIFSFISLHNDVDIKIVIIYKKMKVIHFRLILQGFWSILVKRLRRKHFFSEKCYVCWKYPLLFIFNTKGEGSCISDLLIQQQNHVQMFTGFLFSFGSPVIRLGLRFPTIIQQSCCKETLRMVTVRFLVCFCQQQFRYCSVRCLLFIVLIFVRMQFAF